jgi:hypothetical protein
MSRRSRRQGPTWPKRRQWLDRIACDTRLTAGAKSWLMLLAQRSDDTGKPVWGNQARMAGQLGRCERSVRRYLVEAATLGYLQVFRSKPLRGPDGRWCRRKANAYYLCLPRRATDALPAPRRRQRAPYCRVSSGKPSRARQSRARAAADGVQAREKVLQGDGQYQRPDSPEAVVPDLADSNGLSTPLKRVRQPAPHPSPGNTQPDRHSYVYGLAAARAALKRKQPPSDNPHPSIKGP